MTVGERLPLQVVFRNGSCKLVIVPSLLSTVVVSSYRKMTAQVNFIAFLWFTGLLLQVCDCNRRLRIEKTMSLNSVGERVWKCYRENWHWWGRQIKPT